MALRVLASTVGVADDSPTVDAAIDAYLERWSVARPARRPAARRGARPGAGRRLAGADMARDRRGRAARRSACSRAPPRSGSGTRHRRSRSILFVPELPELEAFVIAQREALTAEPIVAIPVAHFATVKTIDPPIASLAGQRFTSVGRRAKRILFEADGGDTLVLHLMSAGKLDRWAGSAREAPCSSSSSREGPDLMMTETGSKRRAAAWLLRPDALAAELAHIGPEPLDPAFTVEALRAQLEARPHQLHGFLRDQRAIAGIGRAFANEILHAAMLSPYQRGATLTDEELERLHAAITGVLGDAVERLVPLSTERPHDQGRRAATPCTTASASRARAAATHPARLVRGAHRLLLPDLPDRRPDPRRQASVAPLTGIDAGES